MRERRLAVAALAAFALMGGWHEPVPVGTAPGTAHPVAAALPPVSAPPAGRTPRAALPPDVQGVRAHLERYASRTGLTDHELDALAEQIVRESHRYAIDPSLVLAVMHVESRYDTYAVSDREAIGLMQILPSTGAWLAPQVGVAWRGPQTLFDPISNVRIGVAYLRQLTDRYDGDLAAALAAYNWGPGHIDGRLRRGVPLPKVYAGMVLAAYEADPARS